MTVMIVQFLKTKIMMDNNKWTKYGQINLLENTLIPKYDWCYEWLSASISFPTFGKIAIW